MSYLRRQFVLRAIGLIVVAAAPSAETNSADPSPADAIAVDTIQSANSAAEQSRSEELARRPPKLAQAPGLPFAGPPVSDWSIGNAARPDFYFAKAFHCAQQTGFGRPWCHFQYERVRADRRVHPSSEREFLASLKPGVPVLVVVHGIFIPTDEYRQFFEMYRYMRSAAPHRPLHVVFYRWPSHPGLKILAVQPTVGRLENRADQHGFYLARLLTTIPQANPVSVFAHSLGTRTASSALHLLGGGSIHGVRFNTDYGGRRKYRVIYGAAAMEHQWLMPGQRYCCALTACEYLLNLKTRGDATLNLFRLRELRAGPALGLTGFTRFDRYLLGPASVRVGEWDISRLVGMRHAWSVYYANPAIARALAPLIYCYDWGRVQL